MKRIIVWVDAKNQKVSQTVEKLKKFLNSTGLQFSIVDVCELAEPGNDK